MDMRERSRRLLKILQSGMHERDEAIYLGYLCAIAGESLFMLGPPGTAKSLTARRLKYAFADANITDFMYLMGKFTTPEELFGPISVRALKEDRYERNTEGFLPSAHIVFLDEIWKAGPAIQNTLLTVVNEKVYRNGPQEEPIKLELLVAASNELPTEGMGLEALWDRFLVRLWVDNISDDNKLLTLLGQPSNPYADPFEALDDDQKSVRLSLEELHDLHVQCQRIELPNKIGQVLLQVKKRLQLYNEKLYSQRKAKPKAQGDDANADDSEGKSPKPFYLSDRRLLKITRLLKASALLHGRNEITLTDLAVLPYCLWDSEEQMATARSLVAEVLEQHSFSAGGFEKKIEKLRQNIGDYLDEIQKEQAKGQINPRLQATFDEDKNRLFTQIDTLRDELESNKQQQLGQPLFAANTMLKALSKGFGQVQAQLDVLKKGLETGQPIQGSKSKSAKQAKQSKVSWAGKKPSEQQLKQILAEHKQWLETGKAQGKQAQLQGADLSGAQLNGALLCGADLRDANLTNANLEGADFRNAYNQKMSQNFPGADLRGANFDGASLRNAYYNNSTQMTGELHPQSRGMIYVAEDAINAALGELHPQSRGMIYPHYQQPLAYPWWTTPPKSGYGGLQSGLCYLDCQW